MSSGAFERCVGDNASFIEEYWGRRPLHVPAARSQDDLISVGDLDRILTRSLLPTAALRLVRKGEPIPERAYTRSFGGRRSEPLRVADPTLVWDHFHNGATIVLEGLHRYWGPLTRFCKDLESDLGHPTQVNAYITPPGAQGFARHVDAHDVFVVQIHGHKQWEVAREVGSNRLEPVHLRAGDVLYVPTDCAHSARTDDRPSIHLTVGVLVQTWGDLFRELLELGRGESTFEERLPIERGRDEQSVAALSKEALRRLQAWTEQLAPERIEARLGRRLLTSRHELQEGMLERMLALPDLGDDTIVHRLQGARVTRDDQVLKLLLSDRELELPVTVEEAVVFVVSSETFTVGDLARFLDEPGRRAFIGRLVREGFLSTEPRPA